MRNKPRFPATLLQSDAAYSLRMYLLVLMACLIALLLSCKTGRTGTSTGKKLSLNVGDISEVTIATRADTTWQLTATSDNQEVVDVSRKPMVPTTGSGVTSPVGEATFLIKGVTVGTASVVFSEKQPGTDGAGLVKKRYRVTVTSK